MLLPLCESKPCVTGRRGRRPLQDNINLHIPRRGGACSSRFVKSKPCVTGRRGRRLLQDNINLHIPCRGGACSSRFVKSKPCVAGAYGMRPTKTQSPSISPLTKIPFGFILTVTEYVRAKFAARELCRRWAWWKHRGWNRSGTARAVFYGSSE